MKTFEIQDHTGHTTLPFDDMVAAGAKFAELKKAGMLAYKKAPDGAHTLIRNFGDTEEETLFTTALQGG